MLFGYLSLYGVSIYDLANVLRLKEAFKTKRKSFYELINALRLYEAFKLEMKSFTN